MIKVKLFQNTVMECDGDLYSFEFDEMINDFLVDNGFMYLDVKVISVSPDKVLLVYDDGK